MRNRARVLVAALLVAALPALASCTDAEGTAFTAPSEEPSAARDVVVEADPILRLGVVGITTLDPAMVNPASSSQTIVADLLYDGLTSYDAATGTVSAAVATTWSVSDDKLTWTFLLDPAAQFSDGRPITAQDVKTSLERVVMLGVKSVAGLRLSAVDGYDEFLDAPRSGLRGIEAVDGTTVVIRLETPVPSLDELLSDPTFGIVPAGTAANVTAFAGAAVGSGPFVVANRTADTIETRRRGTSEAALSGVTLRLYPDTASALDGFDRDEVDVAVVGVSELSDATERGHLVVSTPQQVSLFYGMNVKSEALSSLSMRQAIVKAVDRDAIRGAAFGDGVDTMTGLLGPGVPERRPNACGSRCEHDPDGARFLLSQAFPDGNVPNVHVDYFDDETGREAAIANAIVADLVAVGIPAIPRAHPFDRYGAVVTSGYAELFRFGWIGAYASADAYLDPLFSSGGSDNVFSLADDDVDSELAAARSAPDDAARTASVLAAEDRILDLAPVLPLAQYRSHLVVSTQVNGVVVGHDGTFDLERVTLAAE